MIDVIGQESADLSESLFRQGKTFRGEEHRRQFGVLRALRDYLYED